MQSYLLDSYQQIGQPRDLANYIVRSTLPAGSAELSSEKISIKTLLSGSEVYSSANKRYVLDGQSFLIAVAGERFVLDTRGASKGCCFYFDPKIINDLMAQIVSSDLAGADCEAVSIETLKLSGVASPLGQTLRNIAVNGITVDQIVLASLLAEQGIQLTRLWRKLPLQRKASRIELSARLAMAKDYLESNANTAVSLQELEKVACLSKFHLSRSFSLVYGVPPLRYHQNYRLTLAKQQLQAGKSQTQVSDGLGFSSNSAFCRAYLRCHGHSASLDQPN